MSRKLKLAVGFVLAAMTDVAVAVEQPPASMATDAPSEAPDSFQLDEVVILASRNDIKSDATDQTKRMLDVPASLGDAMQTVFALPGIVQPNESKPNPAVRGSGPQDNAFLVDGLPAGALFHSVMGNSIFPESVLRDFGLHAAGFSAEYGNATGAVFDIELREPRNQSWETTLEGSVLRAGVLLEGALGERQRSYFSYRESLVHLVLPSMQEEKNKEDEIEVTGWPRSRDLLAKYVYDLAANQTLSILALGSQDSVSARYGDASDQALIDPGSTGDATFTTQFLSVGAHWHYESNGTKALVSFGHLDTRAKFSRGNGSEHSNIDFAEWNLKAQWSHDIGQHTLALGTEQQRRQLGYDVAARYRSCSDFSPDCATDPGIRTAAYDRQVQTISNVFLIERWASDFGLSIAPGLRYARDNYLSEIHVGPRMNTQWSVSSNWSVHADWGRYHQSPEVVQLLPLFGNPLIESPRATHYQIGMKQILGQWSWTADIYYKELSKVIVNVDDARRFDNLANGRAYGVEWLLSKDAHIDVDTFSDRWSGWLSVPLSKTERELAGVVGRFNYDTPVVINLVSNYLIGHGFEAGMRWTYRSGFPYTPIVGNKPNQNYPGHYLPVYGEYNSSRAAPYHRLDLRFSRPLFQASNSRQIRGRWFVDIINLYNRKNGGSVVYKPTEDSAEFRLESEESIPLVPSVGIEVTF